jgi:hypothetical protein
MNYYSSATDTLSLNTQVLNGAVHVPAVVHGHCSSSHPLVSHVQQAQF